MKREFTLISDVVYNVYSHYIIDFSANQPQLSNGEIESVVSDINYLVSIGSSIVINVYTNSDGTVFANDNKGNPIVNRNIITIMHVNPYINIINGFINNINGYLSFLFDDGSTFRVYDNDQSFYYYINGVVPNDIKIINIVLYLQCVFTNL
jgi:hypothetical protein